MQFDIPVEKFLMNGLLLSARSPQNIKKRDFFSIETAGKKSCERVKGSFQKLV